MDFLHTIWNIATTSTVIIGVWWFVIVILSGVLITRALSVIQKVLITFYRTTSVSSAWYITIIQAMTWISKVATWIIIMSLVASRMGVPPGMITAMGTVIGAALGFGSQETVRDVVKGGVHLLEKQFSVGDYVGFSINGTDHAGVVTGVSLRTVVIATEEQGLVTVPQGNISLIKNYSHTIGEFLINLPFDTSLSIAPIIEHISDITDEVGKPDSTLLGKYLSTEDLLDISTITHVVVRGVSAVDNGRITVQVKGDSAPGKQFAAKRALLKAIAGYLEEKDIHFYALPDFGGEKK